MNYTKFNIFVGGGIEMLKTQLSRYCPNCQSIKHEPQAAFCFQCGKALKNGSLQEFYLSLKIPFAKIETEKRYSEKYSSSSFPFFLWKYDRLYQTIEVVTFHEYPKGIRSYLKLPALLRQADSSEEILLKEAMLDQLLKEGFEWFHQTEKETLW